jgi:hypothetical protein
MVKHNSFLGRVKSVSRIRKSMTLKNVKKKLRLILSFSYRVIKLHKLRYFLLIKTRPPKQYFLHEPNFSFKLT